MQDAVQLTNKNGDLVLDVADKNLHSMSTSDLQCSIFGLDPYHTADNVGPGALLVDQGERGVKVIGNGCRTLILSAVGTVAGQDTLTASRHRHRGRQ